MACHDLVSASRLIATVSALIFGTLAAAAVLSQSILWQRSDLLSASIAHRLAWHRHWYCLAGSHRRLRHSLLVLDDRDRYATFCVVVVYNNVLARFRRMQGSLIEASMDLGANSFQTFRYVVFPNIATALLAGGMLAFALSFDEVIVTTFTAGQQTTLPIWIFSQLSRPRDRPVTNVAAMLVMLITFLPIFFAQRLSATSSEYGPVKQNN